ncbi:MAG: hypothetical protein KDJ97_35705 [Anaerolineae bacterium]|nr:hypothetical protein [Anaerolineae bacterium]MCB9108511.1 hypothetical protein [Anaerolineales bacterium]
MTGPTGIDPTPEKSRVAVLGTLAEFHREPIPFDLAALVRLVDDLDPDFLCLEMTPQRWQQQDFSDLPPEFGEALLPLAYQTDMVVVPIAEADPPAEPAAAGWRGRFIEGMRWGLALIVRSAPTAAAMNQGWRHDWANRLYSAIARLAGGEVEQQWHSHQQHMIEQVANLCHRDPGRRTLVVVNVRHCHHLRPALDNYSDIEVVPFSEL